MTDFKAIPSSLEERGFCVIPEFLNRDEIDFLVADFDASPDYSPQIRTKHAARHLGDQPVAGQTGALRSNAMGCGQACIFVFLFDRVLSQKAKGPGMVVISNELSISSDYDPFRLMPI